MRIIVQNGAVVEGAVCTAVGGTGLYDWATRVRRTSARSHKMMKNNIRTSRMVSCKNTFTVCNYKIVNGSIKLDYTFRRHSDIVNVVNKWLSFTCTSNSVHNFRLKYEILVPKAQGDKRRKHSIRVKLDKPGTYVSHPKKELIHFVNGAPLNKQKIISCDVHYVYLI